MCLLRAERRASDAPSRILRQATESEGLGAGAPLRTGCLLDHAATQQIFIHESLERGAPQLELLQRHEQDVHIRGLIGPPVIMRFVSGIHFG